ncbi:hypothetical protein N7486_007648 [Penicillium sp. IBT 16267x]|nr:hypothetical protein N7486_007648 [Penicillium sp. IBT 16267x]
MTQHGCEAGGGETKEGRHDDSGKDDDEVASERNGGNWKKDAVCVSDLSCSCDATKFGIEAHGVHNR